MSPAPHRPAGPPSWPAPPASPSEPISARPPAAGETLIKITIADTVIMARLADNATAHELAAPLPLTLAFTDFHQVEKIAQLPSGCPWPAYRQGSTPTSATSATTPLRAA
jgi:hypothetical protein